MEEPLYPKTERLRLADYLQRVLENNSTIQARLAGFHSSRSLLKAEDGLYEPAFVGSTEWVDRKRPNTIEIERSLRSGGEFIERNWTYGAGVEVRTPIGGRVRIGASGRELRNNVQRTVIVDLDAEYELSADALVEQPLLKNAGWNVTYAPRRMAARTAELAFQDYRHDLMQIIAQAETAYWELSLAQEQVRLSRDSVKIAQTLLDDNRARFAAGRGAELDVLESQAGLAMRQSRLSAARQRHVEAINRVAVYFGGWPQSDGFQYETTQSPQVTPVSVEQLRGGESVLAQSPNLLRAYSQVEQEKIRVKVAKNQRLPQVDLTGAFATSGLGYDWKSSYTDVEKINFPQWRVGLQMRVPLLAGIRERNELTAARQRLLQAERNARELEVQVRTELDAAVRRVEATATTARSNRAGAEFRAALLRDRLKAREAGRMETRIVLEAEQELLQARLELLDSEVEFQRTLLELQVLKGSLLKNRGVELSMEELQKKTRDWMRTPGVPLDALRYQAPTNIPTPSATE
jgi:outer membrane protein TolC